MELKRKHFTQLTTLELLEILKVRVAVFVVEQQCPYQEIDHADPQAWHLWLEEDGEIVAYARALPPGVTYPEASLGRVLAVKRHCGYASRIVGEAIRTAQEQWDPHIMTIGAQVYARGLYEKHGFVQCSEEYLEDGIPHIKMQLRLKLDD